MKFKANYHLATRCRLEKIEKEILNYPKEYPTPKYLLFIKQMLQYGWKVKIYKAGPSKYIFVTKDERIYKIRFSNHRPIYTKELENDCDFYVGISNIQVSTTQEIVSKILKTNA